MQFFDTPEGYAMPKDVNDYSQGFEYVYNYKDHLGNVRLSYTDADGNGSIDPANEIVKESNYYPFGLSHQGYNGAVSPFGNSAAKKYMFGGKELDESFNGTLNTYDFGARNYDPALGRWMNLDPLAEQMRRHSPYNYAFDNPIYFIDPDGMAPCPPGIDCNAMVGAFKRFFGIKDGPKTVSKSEKFRLPRVNFTVKGGKAGLMRSEVVKDRTANITTFEVDVVMELTNVIGPTTPAGSTAIVPDGDGVYTNSNDGSNTAKGNKNPAPKSNPIDSNNTMVDSNMDNDVQVEYKVEGQLKENARYGINYPDYGGTGESDPTNDPEKVKKDSAEFAKTNLFESLRIRRDTIEN